MYHGHMKIELTRLLHFFACMITVVASPVIAEELRFPAASTEVRETAVSQDGSSLAFVIAGDHGEVLFINNVEVAAHDEISQVEFAEGGQVVYAVRDGDDWSIVSGDKVIGPFEKIYIPDLEVLTDLAIPEPSEWSFMGGSRVVFAGRNRQDEWTAFMRFPGNPQKQEQRPLPITRALPSPTDPSAMTHRPLHYRMVRGKVPAFIGISRGAECFYVDNHEVGCGRQVVMLAMSGASGRTAVAWRDRDGLYLHTGHQVHGPTLNVDWISFSPSGNRLAFVQRQDGEHLLIVDDIEQGRYPQIDSLLWAGDGRLIKLVHEESGSKVFVDDLQLAAWPLIERLFLSPSGTLHLLGRAIAGLLVDPGIAAGSIEAIWSEGFLTGGAFYAIARLAGGGQALLFNDQLSSPRHGFPLVSVSPSGSQLAAVGVDASGETVYLDGADKGVLPGHAEQLLWCRQEELLVKIRKEDQECLVRNLTEMLCCPRLVFAGCSPEGRIQRLCMGPDRYGFYLDEEALGDPFDEVPLHLVYLDSASGDLAFAARRDEQWSIVSNGVVQDLDAAPVQLYPTAEGPWFEAGLRGARKWVTPHGSSAAYTSVSVPFETPSGPIFRAVKDGRQAWVTERGPMAWHDSLRSLPQAGAGQEWLYWAVDGDSLGLQRWK
jgi:hypothetical protein